MLTLHGGKARKKLQLGEISCAAKQRSDGESTISSKVISPNSAGRKSGERRRKVQKSYP